LRRNQIIGLHFRRQHVIDGFIVYFYCHKIKLVVEIDGPIHQYQNQFDGARERIRRQQGLHLMRFANDEVMCDVQEELRKLLIVCEKLLGG